ncbi:MAG TPA: carboxylating nicotinate-nucleotide diphosphorylase [Pedococcus sp.]|jgi:nicotinate-nucleotide pyrophosphorylase (carboxylating)|uniref:carboxylating nicotinate-nucleotide diphosphorylase n=1 Tax=Pedococcus sp. TaxID=2860345 RepID=UPI002F91E1C1
MSDAPDLAFPQADAAALVRTALDEDLGPDSLDVTTLATFAREATATAQVLARGSGVVAGMPVLALVLGEVAGRLGLSVPEVLPAVWDGERVHRGDVLATVTGPTQVLLVAERTMLNILSRLSGVATHTRHWADALEGTACTVLDTRKTTPGMRALQKYAVRAGGGTNKRMGLYDTAMIKDNHKLAAGSLTAAYRAIRERFPQVPVQVEVTTVDEALEAVRMGARFILCDNMSVALLRDTVTAVRATGERVEVEATGGLTLAVAREYAETGVDYLSVGALTHSSPILDIALDVVEP